MRGTPPLLGIYAVIFTHQVMEVDACRDIYMREEYACLCHAA